MKRKIFIVQAAIFAIISFSISNCSKDEPIVTPTTTFKFVVDGITYNWDGNYANNSNQGSLLSKTSWNGNTYYTLAAYPLNAGIYTGIDLKLNTSTLSTTTYTLATTTRGDWVTADHHFGYSAIISSSSEVGDFATITITKIHDGYIDGTFTARLTKQDVNLVKVNITEGEFHNVKIVE